MFIESLHLRKERQGSGPLCRAILGELPEWFGLPEAVQNYGEVSDRSLTVVASDGDEDIGLLTLVDHSAYAAEVYVMAVRPAYHRRGVGRRRLAHAEELLVARAVEYLQVKTLSERRPDLHYAATRALYLSCGFRPLEEFPTLWGRDNPALQLVKRLDETSRHPLMASNLEP